MSGTDAVAGDKLMKQRGPSLGAWEPMSLTSGEQGEYQAANGFVSVRYQDEEGRAASSQQLAEMLARLLLSELVLEARRR